MRTDKERPEENTCRIVMGASRYGRISARQNRVCPCQPMVSSGMGLTLTVGRHDIAEHLAVGGRSPGDGVCTGINGLHDALFRRAAGSNDRNIGVCVLYPADQIRRICRRGDIEDIRTCLQAGFKIRFLSRDRHYHGDIDRVSHERQHLVRGRVVEHDAGRAPASRQTWQGLSPSAPA